MQIHVFVIFQILLSVVAQHGQIGLCFFDSKDSTLNYMRDIPDNHELHLLARGKQNTACYIISVSTLYKITFLFSM